MKIKAVIVDEKPKDCVSCMFKAAGKQPICTATNKIDFTNMVKHCPLKTEAEYASQFPTLPSDAGWISVSDAKPDDKQYVIVDCEHGVTMAEYMKFPNGNELWYAVTAIGTYDDSEAAHHVTRWMPLPTAPEKGGQP